MREIIFRGKRQDTEKWFEGYYMCLHNANNEGDLHFIVDKHGEYHRIDPDTVCQYMGLTDKNGNKIFERDICHFYGGEYYSGFWETNHTCEIEFCHECFCYLENAEYVEVIGNIFDNPELI